MIKKLFSTEHITFSIIVLLGALVPVFFLPYLPFSLQASKTFLFGIGILLALLFFVVGSLRAQRIIFPKNIWIYSILLLPLAYALSTIFTSSGFSIFTVDAPLQDSFAFIAFSALLALLVAFSAHTPERVLTVYGAIAIGGFVALFFHVVRFIFGSGVFAFGGLFFDPASSLVGTLNHAAIFFGLVATLVLIAFATLELWGALRIVLFAVLGLCIAFLLLVYVDIVWVLVGLAALGTFVAGFVHRRGAQNKKSPTLSITALAVLGITIVMLFGGRAVSDTLSSFVNIQNVEVRPSWGATLDVGRNVIGSHPLWGTGPGNFADAWSLYRPNEVNQTLFWDTRFPMGQGFVSTAFITTGLVGAVAWVLFFIGLLVLGIRSLLFSPAEDAFSLFFRLSAFIGTLYLWIAALFFNVAPALLMLAFLFTGLTYAASMAGKRGTVELVFEENPRLGFVTALSLTILFLAGIGSIFSLSKEFIASALYERSVSALSIESNMDKAESLLVRAAVLAESDTFFRFASTLSLARIETLLGTEGVTEETVRDQFPGFLSNAVANARAAIDVAPDDVRNWMALARVYQAVVPLNIEGAYDGAVAAYAEAEKRTPNNPGILLARANLERAKGDNTAALGLIDQTLALKQNYTEAAFMRAQILIGEGKVKEAINAIEAATLFAQDDPYLYFQLGLLRYGSSENEGARVAFERAVALNPGYANARYFLGLTLARLDDRQNAILQFEEVAKTNPDNEEVKNILANLRSGRSPFGSTSQAEDLEERDSLPVEEAKAEETSAPDTGAE